MVRERLRVIPLPCAAYRDVREVLVHGVHAEDRQPIRDPLLVLETELPPRCTERFTQRALATELVGDAA